MVEITIQIVMEIRIHTNVEIKLPIVSLPLCCRMNFSSEIIHKSLQCLNIVKISPTRFPQEPQMRPILKAVRFFSQTFAMLHFQLNTLM